MQLKIQRTQRMGGVMGGTVVFCLDVQADYSDQEADNIAKYKLGKQVVYNSRASKRHLDKLDEANDGSAKGYIKGAVSLAMAAMNLNISINSLGRGQHIECKDLEELLEAEEAVMVACRNVKRFLDTAATFNGSIALIDFDDGEKLHTEQGSLELLSTPSDSLRDALPSAKSDSTEYDTWQDSFESWDKEKLQKLAIVVTIVGLLLFVLVKCV